MSNTNNTTKTPKTVGDLFTSEPTIREYLERAFALKDAEIFCESTFRFYPPGTDRGLGTVKPDDKISKYIPDWESLPLPTEGAIEAIDYLRTFLPKAKSVCEERHLFGLYGDCCEGCPASSFVRATRLMGLNTKADDCMKFADMCSIWDYIPNWSTAYNELPSTKPREKHFTVRCD